MELILIMAETQIIFRMIPLYAILHVILFFMEYSKYRCSNKPLGAFLKHGMYKITYLVLIADLLVMADSLMIWLI